MNLAAIIGHLAREVKFLVQKDSHNSIRVYPGPEWKGRTDDTKRKDPRNRKS
jgi:hypothetical protein